MNVRCRLAILALLAAGLTGSAYAYQWGWGPLHQVTNTPDNSALPTYGCGFANVNGYLHAAFADKQGTVRVLYYVRSFDHGTTWQSPVVVEERSQNNTFSIAADSTGNVHLVNRRFSDNGLYYVRSTDNGVTWLPAVQMTAACENMVLLTNRQQNVYVFSVLPGIPAGLEMYKSTNGGADWTAAVTIHTAETFGGLCGTAADNGIINLFYAYGGMSARVYQLRSTDAGASWSSETQVTGVAVNSGPVGAWAQGDAAFLVTTTFGSPQNFRRSTDGGATWESGQTLPVLVRCAAWTRDGTAHAVATRGDTETVWLKSTNAGAAWSTPLSISGPQSGTRSSPYIGVDDSFRLNAIWGSLQTGNVELFAAVGDTAVGIAEPKIGRPPVARLGLSPNPARNVVRLAGASGATVFDRNGGMVIELVPGANDVSRLESGVYFVRARNSATTRFAKLR